VSYFWRLELFRRFFSFLQPVRPVPESDRANFRNLFFDIGWFGILNGSTIAFLSIYAARIGANTSQLGFITAAPAIISLIFALPSGNWLGRRQTRGAVVTTAILSRMVYLVYVPLPFLLDNLGGQTQVLVIILATLVMSIPGTALAMGFNALFAEAVRWNGGGYVVGVRNAVFAVTTTLATLLCGRVLVSTAFPMGYVVVFGLGFLGAAMSAYHLFRVHTTTEKYIPLENDGTPLNLFSRLRQQLRTDILRGPFGRVLFLLIAFHLAQYLPAPIFPAFSVNVLKLSDQIIGLGSALFYVTVFIGSLRFARLSARWGNRLLTGVGLVMLGIYPVLLGISTDPTLYLITSLVGGFAWSVAGGAYYNYLLENVPPADRPAHLAWFTIGANAAILVASIIGPLVGNWLGLSGALIVLGAIRMLTGFSIARWG